jgi:hypothetical protein
MNTETLSFIWDVLQKHKTTYCDEQRNCSCESCGDNFSIEQAQRYVHNDILKQLDNQRNENV